MKQKITVNKSDAQIELPDVHDAGAIAVGIVENLDNLSTQEQSFFVAGFQECIKYLMCEVSKKS